MRSPVTEDQVILTTGIDVPPVLYYSVLTGSGANGNVRFNTVALLASTKTKISRAQSILCDLM